MRPWQVAVTGLLAASTAGASCPAVPGDVTGDGGVNVVDVQCVVLTVVSAQVPACAALSPDVNCDGATNVTDAVLDAQFALALPLAAAIDADGDGCPDACALCTPNCAGKQCGDDGCGGSCGTCSGSEVCTQAGQCVLVEQPGPWRVGVDYHATGADFTSTVFVPRYHNPAVRQLVQNQLAQMAGPGGADLLFTRLWFGANPGDSGGWLLHFPPTQQEMDDLRQYVEDVAALPNPPDLYLCLLWLWCSEYRQGSPSTTLGHCDMTAAQYEAAMEATLDSVVAAVRGVWRADGTPAVRILYLDGEVLVASGPSDPAAKWEKKNLRWWLQTFYPGFVQRVRLAGMIPSLYFLVAASEDEILDNDFHDSTFPVLDRHRSAFWIYRSLRFLSNAGLPIPFRIDFSAYPANTSYPLVNTTWGTLYSRIFDDLEAVLPDVLGTMPRLGLAETWYFSTPIERWRVGKAIAAERLLRGTELDFVSFWTTPWNNGQTDPSAPPFAFDAFRTDDFVEPFASVGDPSFEHDSDGDGLPDAVELWWVNGSFPGSSVTRAYLPGGAFEGNHTLRLEAGSCASCTGSWDGVWTQTVALPVGGGGWVAARVWHRNAVWPVVPAPGVTPQLQAPVLSLLAHVNGTWQVVQQTGTHYGAWQWHRQVLVAPLPAGTDAVRLRMGLLHVPDAIVDFDWLH